MNFKYFTRDITIYLSDDIVAQTGRVWTAYIYDADKGVHLCDISPSYECFPVTTFTEHRVDDDLHADLQAHEDQYFYCYSVKGRDFTAPDRDPDDTDEEYLEQVLEYCRANCGMFEVAL